MNLPFNYYRFGVDSLFMHLRTGKNKTAREWIEELLTDKEKSFKVLRIVLGLNVNIMVDGKPQLSGKINLDVQPIPGIGFILEIEKDIVREHGRKLVFWLSEADSTIKEKIDILTRDQVAKLLTAGNTPPVPRVQINGPMG